jgi:hypothetical protein
MSSATQAGIRARGAVLQSVAPQENGRLPRLIVTHPASQRYSKLNMTCPIMDNAGPIRRR